MIEPTIEMLNAYERAADVALGHRTQGSIAGLAAVLAIVVREHVILPRGAQALCCGEHPEAVIRWGECPVCVAEMPPEERT